MSVEAPLSQSASRSRFNILSLNKNKKKSATEKKLETEKPISTITIQDDSFDSSERFITRRRGNFKHVSTSPIVIDDSFEALQNDVSYIKKTPSPSILKNITPGRTNVDWNITPKTGLTVNLTNVQRPSPGGWSPAQNIICGSPKFTPTPSRSKDIANESLEECSIKKIHQSHKDILDELYGDVWRSIPTLFKKKQQKRDADLEEISKKLNFFDNDEDNSEIFDLNYCDERTNGILTPKTNFQNNFFDKETQNTGLNKVSLDRERPKTELKKVIRDDKRPTTDVKKKIFHDSESDKENSDLFDSSIKHFYIDKCLTPKVDLKTDTRTKRKLYTEKNFDTPEVRRIKRELLDFTDPKPKSKPTADWRDNGIKSVQRELVNFRDPNPKSNPTADWRDNGIKSVQRELVNFRDPKPKSKPTADWRDNGIKSVQRELVNFRDPKPKSKLQADRRDNGIKCVQRELVNFTDPKPKSKPTADRRDNGIKSVQRELVNFADPKPKSKPTADWRDNGIKSATKLLEVEKPLNVKKLSFMGSLAENVPTWRCDPAALDFKTNYKTKRDQLARRLFLDFNKMVFDGCLENDMPVTFDSKLRTTAGTATNRLIKTSNLVKVRVSSIKLSTKVVDGPQRLRDTLIHEMCHVATWIIDHEFRAGHGPLWKKWAKRALRVYPELEEISRCHTLQIHFKYSYKCQLCGYSVNRHSKSIDTTKKCCGYCRGKFVLIVNKKTKEGVVVSTPARRGEANDFALYVKQNYASMKDGTRTHAQVMKILGEQYSLKKKV